MAKLLQVFLNADMRCGHEGLESLAKQNGINIKSLEPGTYLVFVNSAKDRIKVYTAYNVIAYMKSPHGKLDLRAISLIPKAFEGKGNLNYDEALKEVLLKELSPRGIQ